MGPGIRVCLATLVATMATSSTAEIYRCPPADGVPRFTSNASACPGAEPVDLGPDLQTGRAAEISPAAPSPSDAPPTGPSPSYAGDLGPIFVPVGDLDSPWEVVNEAPKSPARDEVMLDWGVRAVRALHYTRYEGPVSQVCSIEIWAFESADRAAAAERGFERPGWRFMRRGNLLVTLRAITLERGRGATRGIFDDCDRLGDRTSERAAARLSR